MKEKTKLCVIPEGGILPIREGIHGPIHNPSEFTLREIVTLITSGIKIYEVNPYNKGKKILLTFQNATADNFPVKKRAKVISTNRVMVNQTSNPINTMQSNSDMINPRNINVTDRQPVERVEKVSKPDFF